MSNRLVSLTPGLKFAIAATGLLGLVSLCCLVMYYAALLDIWHESGSPDFWAGEGVASFEWKWLAVLFWPMFLFHVVFLGTGYGLLVRFRPRGTDMKIPANDVA